MNMDTLSIVKFGDPESLGEFLFENVSVYVMPESGNRNTHLLCRGKYHCSADFQFDWFGFHQTSSRCVIYFTVGMQNF